MDLIKEFKNLGIKKTDTVLVHSSMKAIGDVPGGAESVIDALISCLTDGLLIFPTHSWSKITKSGDLYDPKVEPSCVGILTNLFMKRTGVFRSLHPTHSVTALGRGAKEYVQLDDDAASPAPWSGCWGELYRREAKILFLGCPTSKNTYIHSVEEWCNIPNRLSKEPIEVLIKKETGEIIKRKILTHKAPIPDISLNYKKITPLLLEKQIITKGRVGDATCYLCRAKEMGDMTREILMEDPDYFLTP